MLARACDSIGIAPASVLEANGPSSTPPGMAGLIQRPSSNGTHASNGGSGQQKKALPNGTPSSSSHSSSHKPLNGTTYLNGTHHHHKQSSSGVNGVNGHGSHHGQSKPPTGNGSTPASSKRKLDGSSDNPMPPAKKFSRRAPTDTTRAMPAPANRRTPLPPPRSRRW